jgi:AcrR family transcriptional regulator
MARDERHDPSTRRGQHRRGPGRPTERDGGRDVREALLEVAGQLFGEKQGLYEALLERALSRVLVRVREIVAADDEGIDVIADLLRVVVGQLSSERWIPSLIIREVIADTGGFRERFIRDFASQIARIVPEVLGRELAAGRLRQDLDLPLTFVSLLGMMAWPFAARPVLERVLGLDFEAEDFAERFSEHTRRLFLDGARPREANG